VLKKKKKQKKKKEEMVTGVVSMAAVMAAALSQQKRAKAMVLEVSGGKSAVAVAPRTETHTLTGAWSALCARHVTLRLERRCVLTTLPGAGAMMMMMVVIVSD
jgi:hypothetical protein